MLPCGLLSAQFGGNIRRFHGDIFNLIKLDGYESVRRLFAKSTFECRGAMSQYDESIR